VQDSVPEFRHQINKVKYLITLFTDQSLWGRWQSSHCTILRSWKVGATKWQQGTSDEGKKSQVWGSWFPTHQHKTLIAILKFIFRWGMKIFIVMLHESLGGAAELRGISNMHQGGWSESHSRGKTCTALLKCNLALSM
jgi:hypothetical protein